MRTLFISILIGLSFLRLPAFAQGFTNKADATNKLVEGKKDGKWLEYLDNYTLETNDMKEAKYYSLTVYKAGAYNGTRSVYYLSGKLFYKTIWVNNKLTDKVEKMYYESGQLMSEEALANGQPNGLHKQYYETGILQAETPYTNGKMNGLWKQYYASGKLKREIPMVNGLEDGEDKEYYESGQLKSKTVYTNDKPGVKENYNDNR